MYVIANMTAFSGKFTWPLKVCKVDHCDLFRWGWALRVQNWVDLGRVGLRVKIWVNFVSGGSGSFCRIWPMLILQFAPEMILTLCGMYIPDQNSKS